VAASLPKTSLSKKRKVDKEYAEVFKTFGHFLLFYGGKWDICMFGVLTAGFRGEKISDVS